jgi:hypothetical protein
VNALGKVAEIHPANLYSSVPAANPIHP